VPFAVIASGGQSGNFWIHSRMFCLQNVTWFIQVVSVLGLRF